MGEKSKENRLNASKSVEPLDEEQPRIRTLRERLTGVKLSRYSTHQRSGNYSPEQSGDYYPKQPGDYYPEQSRYYYPKQSGDYYPKQSGDYYPEQSRYYSPDQSGDYHPEQSGDYYPKQSGDYYPKQSGDYYPKQSRYYSPDQSGDYHPDQSRDEQLRIRTFRERLNGDKLSRNSTYQRSGDYSPERSEDYSSERSEDYSPEQSGDYHPEQSGDEQPRIRTLRERLTGVKLSRYSTHQRSGDYSSERSRDYSPERSGDDSPGQSRDYAGPQSTHAHRKRQKYIEPPRKAVRQRPRDGDESVDESEDESEDEGYYVRPSINEGASYESPSTLTIEKVKDYFEPFGVLVECKRDLRRKKYENFDAWHIPKKFGAEVTAWLTDRSGSTFTPEIQEPACVLWVRVIPPVEGDHSPVQPVTSVGALIHCASAEGRIPVVDFFPRRQTRLDRRDKDDRQRRGTGLAALLSTLAFWLMKQLPHEFPADSALQQEHFVRLCHRHDGIRGCQPPAFEGLLDVVEALLRLVPSELVFVIGDMDMVEDELFEPQLQRLVRLLHHAGSTGLRKVLYVTSKHSKLLEQVTSVQGERVKAQGGGASR